MEGVLEWQAAYKVSLRKQGSLSVETMWSIFVGLPELGKSSLKHPLLCNTLKAVKTGTVVMGTPELVRSEQYKVRETTSAWQAVM